MCVLVCGSEGSIMLKMMKRRLEAGEVRYRNLYINCYIVRGLVGCVAGLELILNSFQFLMSKKQFEGL